MRQHPIIVNALLWSLSSLTQLVHANDNYERSLQSQRCPVDTTLKKDGVWYDVELTISSWEILPCSEEDWTGVRDFLEAELDSMNLWDAFGITDMHPHLCPATSSRRHLVRHEAPLLSNATTTTARGLYELSVQIDLVYLGGGKCFFCYLEDDDSNSRSLAGESRRDTEHGQNRISPNIIMRGLAAPNTRFDLAQSRKHEGATLTRTNQADAVSSIVMTDNDNDNNIMMMNRSSSNNKNNRRNLGCGGCFRLKFKKDSQGNRFQGTPYLDPWEFWDSHGTMVRAFSEDDACYHPNNMVRLFDTKFKKTGGMPISDPSLGAPNQKCPGGGPGRGAGGEPLTPDGEPNRNANCRTLGNVLIVQGTSHDYPNVCHASSAAIHFDFRYPVTLNKIGLVDIQHGSKEAFEVYTEEGIRHVYSVSGKGMNSIEAKGFHQLKRVKKVIVRLRTGAVRHIDFCHECGDLDDPQPLDFDTFYPSVDERSYENEESVVRFQEMIPKLKQDISTKLQLRVNEVYRLNDEHCLRNKNVKVEAKLFVSTPVEASKCKTE